MPVVGGFSDLVEVGRGGFSRVYSAYQVEFDRRVALKVLNDRLADDASVAVFEGECRAMGTLSKHPFIVTVHASALTADYRPVIVMELFERGNYMQQLRRDGPLPLEELLSLAVRVGGALATAHHHGVIHGDVKPQNILKSEFGFPALGDFGIATLRDRLAERAGVGLSAHYAAPELVEVGATAAGTAADQYSLAATIFTLATGRRPFESATAEAPERVLARALAAPTPRLAASFPADLADALARAMSRDPQARFPDLGAFAYALAAVEHRLGYRATAVPLVGIDDDATITVEDTTRSELHATQPPTTPPPPGGDEITIALPPPPPPTPPGPPARSPNRRRRLAALAIVLLAAAGAATYLTLGNTGGSEPEPAADESPAPSAEPQVAPADAASAPDPAPDAAPASPGAGDPAVSLGGGVRLTVLGADYVLPGPASGLRGALPADELASWTYDFEAATFVAGDSPAAPFDPSIRPATRDYEIAWVSPFAASEAAQDIEAAIRGAAAASGVRIGAVCDGALDPDETLACANRVAESGADAVIFGNVFDEVAAPAMEVFDRAGLPVVTFDTWHPNAVFVGANSYESGAVAGLNAGRYAQQAWDCAGTHVLLGDLANLSGRANLDLVLTGFADGVQAVCGADVPVSRIEATTSIRQATADWLAANPDIAHVLATSVTDDLAVDMSLAIQQTDRSGIAAAPSAGPAGVARLYEGPATETRFLGSAATLPESYGTSAIAALIDILEGRPVPQEIHTNHAWLNQTNIDQHYTPQGRPTPTPDTPPIPTPAQPPAATPPATSPPTPSPEPQPPPATTTSQAADGDDGPPEPAPPPEPTAATTAQPQPPPEPAPPPEPPPQPETTAPPPAEPGTSSNPGAGAFVTMARGTWATGYTQAAIYHDLLEELGYEVDEPANMELSADLFYVVLAHREVDLWANSWYPSHERYLHTQLADGSFVRNYVSPIGMEILSGGLSGYLTNRSLVRDFGITTLDQINNDPELIALYDAADSSPGDGIVQILGCPESWDCNRSIDDQIEIAGWTNVEQAITTDYDANFARAVAADAVGDPYIVYTWAPSAGVAHLVPGDNAIWLAVERSSRRESTAPPVAIAPEACSDDPCNFPLAVDNIRVTANNWFLDENPAARRLLELVTIPREDVARHAALYEAGENTTADVNRHAADWIIANRAQVDAWLRAAREAAA